MALASAAPELVKARAGSAELKGFDMLAEAEAPAATPVSLVRLSPAGAVALHHAQLQIQPSESGLPMLQPAAAAAPEPARARPARTGRIMTFRIEGTDIRFSVAAGTDPDRMQVLQAAVAQAIAQADDERTRARLGHLLAALDRKGDKFGVITNVN